MKTVSRTVTLIIGLAVAPLGAARDRAARAHSGCGVQQNPTVRTADRGRVICTRRGARVNVVLAVDPAVFPAPEQWWQAVGVRGTGLTELPQPFLAVRGTTLASFRATARGTAMLTSIQHPCAPPAPGRATCDGIAALSG